MAASHRLLVPVEPSLIDAVARYVEAPRKRESIAIGLAARAPQAPACAERTLERAAGIAARLDAAARLRERALASGDLVDRAAWQQRFWGEVALLAVSTAPSWGEGLGRTLALLAHPERVSGTSASRSVQHLSRAIRHLLRSVCELAPQLDSSRGGPAQRPALDRCIPRELAPQLDSPSDEDSLPAWGGRGLATGCVPAEFTAWLGLLLTGERWPLRPLAEELFGARAAEAWRDNARRAARAAERRSAHRLEVYLEALRAPRSRRGPVYRSFPPAAQVA
jgi:hypothetical protein